MRRSQLGLMELFLSGTMLCALATPWPAAAQSPEQLERQREHQGGGDRGPRNPERMERQQQNGAPRQPPQPGPRAPEPRAPVAPRVAPQERASPQERANPQERIAPRERVAPQEREQRQQERQQRQDQRQQRQQERDQRQDDRLRKQEDRQQRQELHQDQRQQRQEERPQRLAPEERRQPGPALRNEAPRQALPDAEAPRRRDRDAPQAPGMQERRNDTLRDDRRDRRDEPGAGPGAGPGVGIGGGFLPSNDARRLDDVRRDRRQVREGDRTFIREPGRTIVEDHGRSFIVHDETARYRALGLDVRRERRGNAFVETIDRPNGEQILVYTDITGRLLRRVRRTRDGREFVLIDNGDAGHIRRYEDDVVVLPLPALGIPRDRYIVDYDDADPNLVYDTLIAPPIAAPPSRYTLDQIRYSPDIRNYVRSVDINTINFDTGSWDVPAAATGQLRALANAIKRALDRDPNSVFMVEGYTDAVGNPEDNLSLSDRRAQSVAEILTKSFEVPPENLVTQGYGAQNLREDTQGPSAVNRRVVVRNITSLLATGPAPDNR